MASPYSPIDLGPLPVDMVNAVLGTELEPGMARLSQAAHRHIALDHREDYSICIRALPTVIASPTFIGQDPKHGRNFVLVRRVGLPDEPAVLVAVGLEMDHGYYAVRTSYLIPQRTIDQRRAAGRLRIPLVR